MPKCEHCGQEIESKLANARFQLDIIKTYQDSRFKDTALRMADYYEAELKEVEVEILKEVGHIILDIDFNVLCDDNSPEDLNEKVADIIIDEIKKRGG